MSPLSPPLSGLTPAAFWRWGRGLLIAGFAFALLLVLWITWKAADLLPFVPVVLLGGVAVWYLFRYPLLNLVLVLAFFFLISDNEEGIQLVEVLYGLYFLGYLAYWFTTRLFLYRERILWNTLDRAMLFFLAWVAFSVFQSFLFQAPPLEIFKEGVALVMLAFYYPVKEVCVRYARGPHIIFGILVWLALFTVLRNGFEYLQIISNAQYLWQVERGRIDTNVIFLLIGALMALIFLLYTTQIRKRVLLAGGFLLCSAGLVLSQTRGYWINFALGVFVVFLLVEWKKKRALLLLGTVFAGIGVGAASILFGDLFIVFVQGLYERLLSIGTATSKDISLVNRFYESADVWEMIVRNPIIGYGMGVTYQTFDITEDMTLVKSFVHNGFLGLWFKFGLVGLIAFLYTWGLSMWYGLQLWWRKDVRFVWSLMAMSVSVFLMAVIPATITSNPFVIADTVLAFGMLMGLASGIRRRVVLETARA